MKKKSARSSTVKRVTRTSRPDVGLAMVASEESRSFLVHAILYVLLNVGLFMYLFANGQSLFTFYLILGGWGVGLLIHALSVVGLMKFLHKEL